MAATQCSRRFNAHLTGQRPPSPPVPHLTRCRKKSAYSVVDFHLGSVGATPICICSAAHL